MEGETDKNLVIGAEKTAIAAMTHKWYVEVYVDSDEGVKREYLKQIAVMKMVDKAQAAYKNSNLYSYDCTEFPGMVPKILRHKPNISEPKVETASVSLKSSQNIEKSSPPPPPPPNFDQITSPTRSFKKFPSDMTPKNRHHKPKISDPKIETAGPTLKSNQNIEIATPPPPPFPNFDRSSFATRVFEKCPPLMIPKSLRHQSTISEKKIETAWPALKSNSTIEIYSPLPPPPPNSDRSPSPTRVSGKFPFNVQASEWEPSASGGTRWQLGAVFPQVPVTEPPEMESTVVKFDREGYGFMVDVTKDGPPIPVTPDSYFGVYIPIRVVEPDAPWDFYVIEKSRALQLATLGNEMDTWYDSHSSIGMIKFEEIQVWGYYAAKIFSGYKHGIKWVRILVTELFEDPSGPFKNGMKCALIDEGGFRVIGVSNIRSLRQEFAVLPWGAYRGCIKTINNNDFKKRVRADRVAKGFQDMVKERGGHFNGMLIEENAPDRLNNQPFVTWEIFLRVVE